MAHAKSSDIFSRRLRILDLANNSDQLSSKWLAEILNVSRRTIFRDIRLMRDAGVIIELSDNPYTDLDLTNAISLPNRCWVMMFYSILWNSMHAEHNENDLSSLWSNLIKSTRVKQQKILHSFPRSFFLSGNHFPPPISKDSLLNQMINALLTRKAFRCEYESHKTLFRPVAVYYTNTWYIYGRSSYHRKFVFLEVEKVMRYETTSITNDIIASTKLLSKLIPLKNSKAS